MKKNMKPIIDNPEGNCVIFAEAASKKEKNSSKNVKIVALVLTAAFAVTALGAIAVSSMSKDCSKSGISVQYNPKAALNNAQGNSSAAKSKIISTIFTAPCNARYGENSRCITDSDCVRIERKFDEETRRYRFTAEGMRAGNAHVTIKYRPDDYHWNTKELNLRVDDRLDVTVV